MLIPPLDELVSRARVVAIPLRVPFRGVTTREVMLFEPREPGHVWSEWAPFLEYDAAESSRWLRSAIHFSSLYSSSENDARRAPQSVPVEVNATIPAVDVAQDPQVIGRLMARYSGCTTVKIKVAEKGQTVEDDLARVRAVRKWFADNYGGGALGAGAGAGAGAGGGTGAGVGGTAVAQRGEEAAALPDRGRAVAATDTPKIRMDANGGWSVEDALHVIEVVAKEGAIDYAEQPCATVEELAQVRMGLMRKGIFARVAADESIRKSADPLAAVREVVNANACDVAVVKVPPLGGVDKLLEIADAVATRGVALTVSSALDTAVGLGAGLEAAARLTRHIESGDDEGVVVPAQAAGLATGTLFEEDLASRDIVDGCIMSGPVEPNPELLERYAASDGRRDWWLARLAAAHAQL